MKDAMTQLDRKLKQLFPATVPLSALGWAACGGGGSTSVSSSSSSFSVSGNAVAGPIDGAIAFVDYDEDGERVLPRFNGHN